MVRTFVGDIHGDFEKLKRILVHAPSPVIQLGDLGIGFPEYFYTGSLYIPTEEYEIQAHPFPCDMKFIRGNHDNPAECRKYPQYLGDYGYDAELGIFYLSGADSFDKADRTEGIDWWRDEELSYTELQKAIDLYQKIKPKVMISHTCPYSTACFFRAHKPVERRRTEMALEQMWRLHQPRYWLFGHWHVVWNKTVDRTKFICLAPNQKITLEF